MRSWFATILLAETLSGCDEYTSCTWGIWPIDGATGVPLDTVIEFASVDPLPDLLPEDLEQALTLRIEEGPAVPFEIELEEDVIRLVPREPLKPGQTYVARGVSFDALRDGETHWWGPYRPEPVTSRFQTGGVPAILGAMTAADGHVVVAFSEPMDLPSLTVAFELVDASTTRPSTGTVPTTGYGRYGYYGYYGSSGMTLTQPVPLTVVGYFRDNPLLVEVDAGEFSPYVSGYGLDVRVDPRSRSVRGPLLDPRLSRVTVRGRFAPTKERWRGLGTCSYWY